MRQESMISTSNLKKLYGPFKAMVGAKQSETLPISEVSREGSAGGTALNLTSQLDFSHCPRSGVSYRKLPKVRPDVRGGGQGGDGGAGLHPTAVLVQDAVPRQRPQRRLGPAP